MLKDPLKQSAPSKASFELDDPVKASLFSAPTTRGFSVSIELILSASIEHELPNK